MDSCLTDEMLEKSWNKRVNLLWGNEVPEDCSLLSFLQNLTKDELAEIRRCLQLRGVSSLKKSELAELLAKEIVEALPQLLGRLEVTQYELLKTVADAGGIAPLKNQDDEQVVFFRQRGLLFSGSRDGERYLLLPQELVKLFPTVNHAEIKKNVQNNSDCLTIIQGMLYYYGTMTLEEIMEQLQKVAALPASFDAKEVARLLKENAAPYFGIIAYEKDVFFHLLADYRRVQDEQALRPTLSWREFSQRELLLAGRREFVDKTDAFLRLAEFIKEYYAITQSEAEGLAEECVYAINDGYSLTELVELLQESLEMDSDGMMQDFVALLTYLTNNTRQWGLKGHTPAELSIHDLAYKNVLQQPLKKAALLPPKVREVGRNESCPCGSGKKYKKCCGR